MCSSRLSTLAKTVCHPPFSFFSFFFCFCVTYGRARASCVFCLPPLFVAGVRLLCLFVSWVCVGGLFFLYACLLPFSRVCSSSTGAALLSPSSASPLCVCLPAACFLRTRDGSGFFGADGVE